MNPIQHLVDTAADWRLRRRVDRQFQQRQADHADDARHAEREPHGEPFVEVNPLAEILSELEADRGSDGV